MAIASTCKRAALLLLGATLAVLLLETATHLSSHWGGCSAGQGSQPTSTLDLGRRDLQQHGLAGMAPELPGAQPEQVDGSQQESPAHDPRFDIEAPLQLRDRPWTAAASGNQPGSATEGAAEADKGSFALGTPIKADAQSFPQPQAPRYSSQPLSLQTMRQLAQDEKAFHEANRGSVKCAHMDQEFFNLTAYRYYQRYPTSQMEELRQMFAVWSAWADGLGIPSWLGSGTLDGWVYGQDILPWDMDIDLRLMTTDLAWLWDTHDDQNAALDPDGRYLLRINKHFILPSPLQNNIIDARVVSTSTGLFIDMVGFQPATMAASGQYSPEAIWASKSPQQSELRSIFPLQRTTFAGSPAWVPNDIVAGTDYRATNGNGHVFTWSSRPGWPLLQGYRWVPEDPAEIQDQWHVPFRGSFQRVPTRAHPKFQQHVQRQQEAAATVEIFSSRRL